MPVVSGYILEGGFPVGGRVVRFYRRDTGALLGQCLSGDGITPIGDPHFDKVKALLHFTGVQGSPTPPVYTDVTGRVWVNNVSNAPIATSDSPMPDGSAFDGSAARSIRTPITPDIELLARDFTIEWRGKALGGSNGWIVGIHGPSGAAMALYQAGTTFSPHFANATTWDIVAGPAASSIDAWNWVAWAVTRSGNVWRVFKNGLQVYSWLDSREIYHATQQYLTLCGAYGESGWSGYLDEFRLTVDLARYTSTYIVDPLEFKNTGGLSTTVPGLYSFENPYSGEIDVVALDFDDSAMRNDQIYRMTPV